jgi:signal peptidase II
VHHVQGSRRVPALGLAHPGRVFAATASTILIADQIAKAVARSSLQLGQPLPFIPGVIRLVMVHNTGAAFGLFPGGRPVFVLTSLLVLFAIAAYWRRVRPTEWPVVIALALVAGGSLGNLIDRALVGQVTDFFEFAFVDFPVFNVADMAIVGGVGLLMVWILFGPQPSDEPAEHPVDGSADQLSGDLGPAEIPDDGPVAQ